MEKGECMKRVYANEEEGREEPERMCAYVEGEWEGNSKKPEQRGRAESPRTV